MLSSPVADHSCRRLGTKAGIKPVFWGLRVPDRSYLPKKVLLSSLTIVIWKRYMYLLSKKSGQ